MNTERTSEFIYNIGDILNEKVIIASARIKDKNSTRERKYYKYRCLKCRFDCGEHYNIKGKEFREELWVLEGNIKKQGCACCRKSPTVIVRGLNDIKTVKPWLSKYFYNEEDVYKYLPSSNKDVEMKCPDCGSKIIRNLNRIDTFGFSCPICSDGISYPEKIMMNILTQLDVRFIKQLSKTTFGWCKNYKYDFYLPDYNCIIETHGMQHYENSAWGKVCDVLKNDIKKEKLAKENNIENYIQLDCRYSDIKYIKDSCYNSNLKHLINLDSVSWEECEKFASKPLVMKVIDDFNNGYTVTELHKKYNIVTNTVRDYLKIGNYHGWCNYLANKTPLLVYKDNELILEVESITKLKNISEKELGIKMSDGGIHKAVTNNKYYKGFLIKRKE